MRHTQVQRRQRREGLTVLEESVAQFLEAVHAEGGDQRASSRFFLRVRTSCVCAFFGGGEAGESVPQTKATAKTVRHGLLSGLASGSN